MNKDTSQSESTRGRWTTEEQNIFNLAYHWYGKNWKKLKELIPTRTQIQIRSHAQKIDKKSKTRSEGTAKPQQVFILESAREDLKNYISSSSSKAFKKYMEYQNELVYAQINCMDADFKNIELSVKGELDSS
jgi:SHAQKYF class myb-like DNA-binding protein